MPSVSKPIAGKQLNYSHPLSRGLVGCWLFNEGSGMQAYDLSPYHNHGSLKNFNDPSSKDRDSQGLTFDGTNDYVDCGNGESLSFGTGSFSISFWFNTSLATTLQDIINKGQRTVNNGYDMWIRGSGNIGFVVDDGPQNISLNMGIAQPPDQWHFITGTFDGVPKTGKLYLNGDLKDEATNALISNIDVGVNINIGGTVSPFKGAIGEILIYNRTLYIHEVKSLYQNPYCMLVK